MAETRHAKATWSGNLPEGSGMLQYISSGAFSRMPVTWSSRTAGHEGRTSPEELLAAAHATCFSMAFANQLAKNGTVAERLDVRVDVTADKREAGWTVLSSAIKVSGVVPGIDAATFAQHRRCGQGRLPDLAGHRRQRRALGRGDAPRCCRGGARSSSGLGGGRFLIAGMALAVLLEATIIVRASGRTQRAGGRAGIAPAPRRAAGVDREGLDRWTPRTANRIP